VAPRFSIITPSYNQLNWLKLCAASIADQRDVEVEHIVQDAGTGAKLEAWAAEQPTLKLFVEKDNGMYDAVNRGLQRAAGEILAYLNCDEQYLPGALKMVREFFENHPEVEVLFGDGILIHTTGQPLSYRRVVLPSNWLICLSHLSTMSCSMFFRRSLVERGLLFDISWRINGDAIWVKRLLDEKMTTAVLRKPLAVYTFTGENLSENQRAVDESRRMRNLPNSPPAWLKVPVLVHHRLKKLLAGAYQSHSCEVSVYTLKSPTQRISFSGRNLWYGWPTNVKSRPEVV
jgi:glycosyltransferase involved in cell wall biosynthesis